LNPASPAAAGGQRLEAHNRPLRPIRARIERIFGTWKRSYHFHAMRWIGLAKAKCQVISPPLPTTSNVIGGCKARERTSNADLKTGRQQSLSGNAVSPLNRQFSKRTNPRLPSQL
jgi:hypothetical protein